MRMNGINDNYLNNLIQHVYSTFVPHSKYLKLLDDIPSIDYGISIRRGEFPSYFPEANQSFNDIHQWMKQFNHFVLFSDDHNFKNELKQRLFSEGKIIYDFYRDGLEQWEQGFVEFLCLALKCKKIYGTPMSSFAIEAAGFGRKFYGKVLDQI